MKGTCTSLSEMLHKIRDRKLEKEGLVEDDMVADAMQLFAQLSGHHKTLVRQVEKEADSIDEVRYLKLEFFIVNLRACNLQLYW